MIQPNGPLPSCRTMNALVRNGVTSDADLIEKLHHGLSITNLGETGIEEIENYLGVKIRQTRKTVHILTLDFRKMALKEAGQNGQTDGA